MLGTIAAVCTSPLGGIPKFQRPSAKVGTWGLEGDYHNRKFRKSFSKPGKKKPNIDRHVLLVSEEVEHALGHHLLGRKLEPGKLAENITTRGLGDLANVRPHSLVIIDGGRVVLRVVQQEKPCKHVTKAYGLVFSRAIRGRRGIMCSIVRGTGQKIGPDLPIEIIAGGETVMQDPPPRDKLPGKAAELENV